MIPDNCVPTLRRLWPVFQAAAHHYGVAPQLLVALAYVESTLHSNLSTPAGAAGLMHMLPATARDVARKRGIAQWNLLDPGTAIDFAAFHLAELFGRFDDVRAIVAAYKIGPELIEQCGGRLPAYIPLHLYVRDVLETAEWLEAHLSLLLDPAAAAVATPSPDPSPDPPQQATTSRARELTVLQTLAEGMRLSVVHGQGRKLYLNLPQGESTESHGDRP